MRIIVTTVSLCMVVFFGLGFGATFFARAYVTSMAREYAIVRTQQLAEPTVAVAERALEAPSVVRLFDAEVVRIARAEIADYRRDPGGYIARHVGGERAAGRMADQRPPGRLPDLKAKVREHWNSTLTRLLVDLRIFCGSNLIAAVIAGWCALSVKEGRPTRLLGVVTLLLASVIYCAYAYVDRLSYFRILFELYVGWWYPVLLGATFGWMYVTRGPALYPRPRISMEGRRMSGTNDC